MKGSFVLLVLVVITIVTADVQCPASIVIKDGTGNNPLVQIQLTAAQKQTQTGPDALVYEGVTYASAVQICTCFGGLADINGGAYGDDGANIHTVFPALSGYIDESRGLMRRFWVNSWNGDDYAGNAMMLIAPSFQPSDPNLYAGVLCNLPHVRPPGGEDELPPFEGNEERSFVNENSPPSGDLVYDEGEEPLVERTWPAPPPDIYRGQFTFDFIFSRICVRPAFGVASPFNAFFFRDYTNGDLGGTDIEGRLAAGRNIDIKTGWSVGDKLSAASGCATNPGDGVMIAGNNIIWSSGRAYFRNVFYGNQLLGNPLLLDPPCIAIKDPNKIDFAAAQTYLRALSLYLSTLPSNTVVADDPDFGLSLVVRFNTASQVLVATVPATKLYQIRTIRFINQNNVEETGMTRTVIFNCPGTGGATSGFNGGNFLNFRSEYTLFNFYQATNLYFGNVDIEASVLAPYAVITTSGGQLNGQVIGYSWIGNMQINLHPFRPCLPRPPVPPSSPCVDKPFGVATGYNAFIRDTYTNGPSGGSDIEGRLAAGTGITIVNSFSVGDKLDRTINCLNDPSDPTLVSGGTLRWQGGGRIYWRNAFFGTDPALVNPLLVKNPEIPATCHFIRQLGKINFNGAFLSLLDLSAALNSLTPTATVENDPLHGLGLVFKFNPTAPQIIAVLTCAQLRAARTIRFINTVTNAEEVQPLVPVIINVRAPGSCGFTAGNFGNFRHDRTVWNFYTPNQSRCGETMWIGNVAIEGSLLAPNFDVTTGWGQLNGQAIACRWRGPLQINWVQFRPCLPVREVPR